LFKFAKINRTKGTGALLTLCHNAYISSFSHFKFPLKISARAQDVEVV
jgi:hypothetical protein